MDSILCKSPLINFELITISGMKPLLVPVSLFCDNKGWSRTISRRRSYPKNVILRQKLKLFVAAAATVYQELDL